MDTNKTNKVFLPLSVLAGALLIAGAIYWNGQNPPSGSGSVALSNVAKKIAEDVKANTSTYQSAMNADKAIADKAGVKATPSLLIGKQVIAGAYPYAAFQKAINSALENKPAVADEANGIAVSAVDSKDLAPTDAPFIGNPSAPLTILFWSDFQCPFCKRFEIETLPQIVKDYVDTGKVKIVMLDFAFLGNDSITAGLYNRAVWKLYPTQYFAWRTAMYQAQDEEGDRGFGNAASIDELDTKTVK